MRKLLLFVALTVVFALVPAPDRVATSVVQSSVRPLEANANGVRYAAADVADSVVAFQWTSGSPGRVEVRLDGGAWSEWATVEGHGEDGGPVPLGTSELYTGTAESLEVRTAVAVTGARLFVASGIGTSQVAVRPAAAVAAVSMPPIVTREAWGGAGCEDYSVEDPSWTNRVRSVVIHHTAGTNSYGAGSVPGIIQAICQHHTIGNGWTDIGYNFLIDRFGTIYEGRRSNAGGDLAVGAHAFGINSQTVGIALLGDFRNGTPSSAMQNALISLLTWLSEQEHINPNAVMTLRSPEGVAHTVYGITGHSDIGVTSCPGSYCYNLLPAFRAGVEAAAGPRIFIKDLSPDHPDPGDTLSADFRFTEPVSWTIRVTDQDGTQLALVTGSGQTAAHSMVMAVGQEEVFLDLTATTASGYAPPPVRLSWHKHYLGRFADDDGSPHEQSIERIAAAGITLGCDPKDLTRYCPAKEVTRAQMATFIVRALGLPSTTRDHFSDDNGHALEASINAFAESGITYGCATGLFCPEQIVPREQMAAFLARALGLPPSQTNGFQDVSGYFAPEINAMASAGIIVACNPQGTLFCPTHPVTRESMASFLDKGFLGG